jgi:uncharacterized membrane protein YjjB (DUF3815 family)
MVLGVELGELQPGAAGWQALPLMALGAGISAAAFAFASYAPLRSLIPIAATAALGGAIWYLLYVQDAGPAWSAASAAIAIGLVSYSVAGRVRVPPLVVVVPAIVPLLPGLSIYRALSLMSVGDSYGITWLVTAAGGALARASGGIHRVCMAQPRQRPVRGHGDRLAGPRLVGRQRARAGGRPPKAGGIRAAWRARTARRCWCRSRRPGPRW